MNKFDYYHNARGMYVVAIDKGEKGFFRIDMPSEEPKWEYFERNSIESDAIYQNIYVTEQEYFECPSEKIKTLPVLPKVPEKKSMSWADNFPNEPQPVADFPYLTAKLKETKDNMSTLWIALFEDLYETSYCGGKTVYFTGLVYEDFDEAEKTVKELNKKNKFHRLNLKRIKIYLKEEMLYVEVKILADEHIYRRKILKRIEDILNPNTKTNWGEERVIES